MMHVKLDTVILDINIRRSLPFYTFWRNAKIAKNKIIIIKKRGFKTSISGDCTFC